AGGSALLDPSRGDSVRPRFAHPSSGPGSHPRPPARFPTWSPPLPLSVNSSPQAIAFGVTAVVCIGGSCVGLLLLSEEARRNSPVKRLMVLGVISALLLCFERFSAGRKSQPVAASPTPRIVTLQEVLRHHDALPAEARAFYGALLAQGE